MKHLRPAATTLAVLLSIVASKPSGAQQTCLPRMDQDPALDNLAHAVGYATAEPQSLGGVIRMGEGPRDVVLIAGTGFGADVFRGFMEANRARYTMVAVTLPGFGGSAAPPMPPVETSYAAQTWTRGAQAAVARLIEQEQLNHPVVIGHWIGATQVALGLARERPDLVRAAVVLSGVPRFVSTGGGMPEPRTPAERAAMIDHYMAPQWFKTVTRETWDDNNFLPADYAIHPLRGLQLWKQAAEPPLPVWIRYLCEMWAADSTERLSELQIPVLIVQPELDDLYKATPHSGDYLRAMLHDGWVDVDQRSEWIDVETIPDSRVFVMDDQPEILNATIERFVTGPGAAVREIRRPRETDEQVVVAAPDFWDGALARQGDRYLLAANAISLIPPAGGWEVEAVAGQLPLVGRIRDPERRAQVTLQVQPLAGMTLESIVPLVEQRLAGQFSEYATLSSGPAKLGGREAFRLECAYEREGAPEHAVLIFSTLRDDHLFSVTFRASPQDFDDLRGRFEELGESIRFPPPGR